MIIVIFYNIIIDCFDIFFKLAILIMKMTKMTKVLTQKFFILKFIFTQLICIMVIWTMSKSRKKNPVQSSVRSILTNVYRLILYGCNFYQFHQKTLHLAKLLLIIQQVTMIHLMVTTAPTTPCITSLTQRMMLWIQTIKIS